MADKAQVEAKLPQAVESGDIMLRLWKDGDQDQLAKQANSKALWKNVRDAFPHPYTKESADFWVHKVANSDLNKKLMMAIVYKGAIAGGIGATRHETVDVDRVRVELGYWIGEEFWGKGIVVASIKLFIPLIWEAYPEVVRIEAIPFARNQQSRRVLEKAGFAFEGKLHSYLKKEGVIEDALMFALIKATST